MLTSRKVDAAMRDRDGRGALFAGGVAAILASVCCLGPLVLLMLGISGAWIGTLTAFEPYRPIFICAALVALFFAYRRVFRPAADCLPGEVCAIPRVRRAYKIFFWVVVVLVVIAVVFPFVAPLFYMIGKKMKRMFAAVAALTILASPAQAEPKTVTLSVPGMTCSTCPITIKKTLSKVDGVTKVDVSYEKLEAIVTYDDAKTNVDALTKATKDAGYLSTVK